MEGFMTKVLVTGASGYIGLHCIEQLLADGYKVRGTVRSLLRRDEIEEALLKCGRDVGKFELCEANLLNPDGWDEALKGCDYVLHVASPFIVGIPKHEDKLIKPAVDGTRHVLNAAIKQGVKRVVLTSSVAAITDTHDGKTVYSEEDWTDTNHAKTSAYYKSKALAEKLAWELISNQTNKKKTELSVINPSAVLGPTLTDDIGTSNEFVRQILVGKVPAAPRLHIGFVDVRDVAKAHILAMENNKAAGERFIICEKEYWFVELCRTLRKAGFKKAPTKVMPNWLVKVFGLFDATTRQMSQLIGDERYTSADKARKVLGWKGRNVEESILDTANQLKEMGMSK
jgi:dihydroflavonol-4-reductase